MADREICPECREGRHNHVGVNCIRIYCYCKYNPVKEDRALNRIPGYLSTLTLLVDSWERECVDYMHAKSAGLLADGVRELIEKIGKEGVCTLPHISRRSDL